MQRELHLMATSSQERTDRLNDAVKRSGLGEGKEGTLFTVKFDDDRCLIRDEPVCNLDTGGWSMFGLIAYGVQVIGWAEDLSRGRLYWLQQRSRNRKVHPSTLDMMAGGGIEDGEEPLEAAIREAHEEAGILPEYSAQHLEPCGTVSYHLSWSHSNSPGSFPHVVYLFKINLSNIERLVNNNEVDGFEPMTESQVKAELFGNRFKPILPIQWICYFVREGILEIDEDLIPRMHRNFFETLTTNKIR